MKLIRDDGGVKLEDVKGKIYVILYLKLNSYSPPTKQPVTGHVIMSKGHKNRSIFKLYANIQRWELSGFIHVIMRGMESMDFPPE